MADKGKKESKGKKTSKKWKIYEVSADAVKKGRKSCPKCGDGVFLAKHTDRISCGKCGYTETTDKKE
ncbi:MAG: 30S ribosomal protein S27ae [Candidatus Altiarchaeota archaeon]|nr:30S ribosomal protein S27ae [Candidatus Altiarchaeota archaeon]